MRRRLAFRTREGFVLETELGNAWPIVEIFRDSHYDVPIGWASIEHVLDVGSHVGAFTIWVAARAPRARITAFEPEPRNFGDLRLNVERNDLADRVSLVNAAVGAEAGTRTLRVRRRRDTSSLAPPGASGSTEVDCVALEDVLTEHESPRIDVLKLDCEGAEWEILRSLDTQKLRRVAHILLECHAERRDQLDVMLEQLEAKGFIPRVLSTGSAPGLYPLLATIWAGAT
jgi:FkbM family methyltransferase